MTLYPRRHLLLRVPMLSGALCAACFTLTGPVAYAGGDSATKFNVFVPADVRSDRPSYLVVTNVSPVSATVDIIDDPTDGDSDDSVVGVSLGPGESYVVRIMDGAVDDDAGGKWDGDYFHITADHPVMVSMGNLSAWQHDWVPGNGKGGLDTSFFVYAIPGGGSINDLNVFAYQDDTIVTVTDISTNTMTGTGKATADLGTGTLVLRTTLEEGEDLNVRNNGLGLDTLADGHSYWVRATNPVTMMAGHLGALNGNGNARDGGGFVPSANGSSAGSLFYFTIPHDVGRQVEKELRVVCPTAGSTVALYGANTTSTAFGLVGSSTLGAGAHLDFVGASNSTFAGYELYKLTVSPPYYGCTVFEANWIETGSIGTSDFASVVSSDQGTGLGESFTAYMGPPGLSKSAVPTGEQTNNPSPSNGDASHLYIFGTEDGTNVTVKDLDTNGTIVDATFTVSADQYYHFVVDTAHYDAMSESGRRPYLRVTSDAPVSVVDGNYDDNWLTYYQSALPPTPIAIVATTQAALSCGDTATITVTCDNANGAVLGSVQAALTLPTGVALVSGTASPTPATATSSSVSWTATSLDAGSSFTFTTDVTLDCATLGCGTANLSSLTAECSGLSGGNVYADVASANVTLSDPSTLHVVSFTVKDDPDYTSTPPNPRVAVAYAVAGGNASSSVKLERVVNNASPTASATVLATVAGAADGSAVSSTYNDTYTPNYQEEYLYRLVLENGSCTSVMGPAVVQTSSGQSSGQAAGLESNGRLAAQLARRALTRATNASWMTPAVRESQSQRPSKLPPSNDLGAALPAIGPDGSTRTDATPADLTDLTNATAATAADYLDSQGQIVATALIVETVGELYEHSKALCDRAGGSQIDLIDTQTSEEGNGLLRMELRNVRKSTGESAHEFKIYDQGGGASEVHSAWLQESYPPPAAGQRILNVQVWSRRPGYEFALAQDLVSGIGSTWAAPLSPPAAYFEHAVTLGGSITGRIIGARDAPSLRATFLLEDGSTTFTVLPLASADLALTFPPFADVTLELLDPSARTLDRVWISDGAWADVDDAMLGGATHVDDFATTGCMVRSGGYAAGDLTLSGCARVTAEVSEFAGVARVLGGGAAPVDLSGYQGVAVTLRSNQSVRMCLEVPEAIEGGAPCVDLDGPASRQRLWIPLDAFHGSSSCAPVRPTSVSTVSFVADDKGALELEAGDLVFTVAPPAHATPTLPCGTQSTPPAPQSFTAGGGGCNAPRSAPIGGAAWTALVALGLLARRLPDAGANALRRGLLPASSLDAPVTHPELSS